MCQSYCRTSQPVMGSENSVPNESALENRAVARERDSGGTQRPTMLIEAGNTAASPSPSAMRARISAGKPSSAAGGVSSVHTDHQITAKPSTRRPP